MCRRISSKKRIRSTGICSSAAIIGRSEDLLTEIFLWLPTKSVVIFKSVSKCWSFIISAHSFTNRHLQNHHRRRGETQHSFILHDAHGRPQFFICHPTSKRLVRANLPRPIKSKRIARVHIIQSMNELVLLDLKYFLDERINYVVFNPTTNQYRIIHLDGHQPLRVCLFFDPSKSEYYKLIMNNSIGNITRFSVYDSATHQWSHDKETPFGNETLLHNHIVCTVVLRDDIRINPNLLAFPETEAYRNSVLESNEHTNMLQLEILRGENENKRRFRVGEMIDNKWTVCKEATLDFGNRTVEVMGMMREESIEDSVFLFHEPGRLLTYKFSNGQDLQLMVDYRSDYFYVEDQLQFDYAFPLIHTFASV